MYLPHSLTPSYTGKYGIMFYNNLFAFVPVLILAYGSGEIDAALAFDGWSDVSFMAQFCLSCVFGFILNFCILLCTHYNSALTTAAIGPIKNILVTYLGKKGPKEIENRGEFIN